MESLSSLGTPRTNSTSGRTGSLQILSSPLRFYSQNTSDPLTGSTGHLALVKEDAMLFLTFLFQSLTGSTGHLALTIFLYSLPRRKVSIPNGLHRPFSQSLLSKHWL